MSIAYSISAYTEEGSSPGGVKQHGAMEYTIPPCDLNAVRMYRLNRVRTELAKRDLSGIILYDQLNTRYACDATNMQIWCSHNEARYLYVPTEGPVVLFDFGSKDILCEGLPTIDEIRAPISFFYMVAGVEYANRAQEWAADIDSIMVTHNRGNKRIAIDRMSPLGVQELERLGYQIFDGFDVMETAREIKSDGEIQLMKKSVEVCEHAIGMMREALVP